MTNVEKKVEFKDIPQSVKDALSDSNEYQKFEAARNKLESQTGILQKNTEERLTALKNELPPDIRAKVENLSDLADAVVCLYYITFYKNFNKKEINLSIDF